MNYFDGLFTPVCAKYYLDMVTVMTFNEFKETVKDQFVITIPGSIKELPDNAFSGWENLREVIIQEGVAWIGECAFENCVSLIEIHIPESVTTIFTNSFHGCNSLTDFRVHPNNPMYCSPNGLLLNRSQTVLLKCAPGLRCPHIPESCTQIGMEAFAGCVSIEKITIPNRITKIGKRAFAGCASLSEVCIPESVYQIGVETFYLCANLKSVTILSADKRLSIHKSVFAESRPTLVAPYLPISRFCSCDKPGAVRGFLQLCNDHIEIPEMIREGYAKYIRESNTHRKQAPQ